MKIPATKSGAARHLKIYHVLLILLGLFLALMLTRNLLFFGQLLPPTIAQWSLVAKDNEFVVQALYDYRADHGEFPDTLNELVPAYLKSLPKDRRLIYHKDDYLIVDSQLNAKAQAPKTRVHFSFRPEDEGWWVKGEFSRGKLPVPIPVPTRRAASAPTSKSWVQNPTTRP